MKISIIKNAVIIAALTFSIAASAGEPLPPVGYAAMQSADHLWVWTGKVYTGMSASTDPTGANMDMSNFHGEYNGEKILANIDGPGCIYRVWSAHPSGTIRFYIDGETEPQIKCNFKNYLEGKCEGLPGYFSVGRTANYMPVPFAKSIIVTTHGFHFPGYYQISYQTYDQSVPVESFDKKIKPSVEILDATSKLWFGSFIYPVPSVNATLEAVVEIPAAAEADAIKFSGPGIIRRIEIKNPDMPDDPLDGVELKISWDAESSPSVNSPLDAFFINRFDLKSKWPARYLSNIFILADKDRYACNFPMPFSNQAVISFKNNGPTKRIAIKIIWEKLAALPDNSMRFHAVYNSKNYETNVTDKTTFKFKYPVDQSKTYVVLDRKGKGHYIGCAIFVESIGTIWWGEGDELTYIDGAEKPQIYGTGTEDEFNWSWGFKPHKSPVSGTLPVIPECSENYLAGAIPAFRKPECQDIRGKNAAYRFRISDYIPFGKSIRVSYEILGSGWVTPNNPIFEGNLTQERGDDYSSVAYWYEAP